MAVHLVFHRVEVGALLAGVAGHDLVRAHHPHASAFLAPAGSGQFTVTGSNWPTTTSSRGGATTPGVPTPGGITTPGGSGSSSGGSSSARVGVEVSLRLQTVPVSGQSAIAYRFELGKVMTDSNGRLRATYPIPPGVPEGAYLIASSGKIEVKTPFTLIAVQPGSPIITQPGVTR